MPEGTPRTDEERRERHKEKYGTEDIPEKRKGLAGKSLEKRSVPLWLEVVLTAALLYILFLLLTGGI